LITITLSLPVSLLSFKLALMELLLEEGSDGVCNTLQLFVALLFRGFEASCYVSANKRHGNGI
jgi:hypothetical protein